MSSDHRGFTLIEVMVALLLMSIMAMLSWRALDSMVRTREDLVQRGQQFDGVRFLFAQWENDCHALGSPNRWLAGVPLHFDSNRIDLIRTRVEPEGVQQTVLVSYLWQDGDVERLESPPILGRAELLQNWDALQQGGQLSTLYSVAPVVLIHGSTGLEGRGFMEGADWNSDSALLNQQWQAPAAGGGNPLLLGIELAVGVPGSDVPLRKVCLTGQS